ncbi:MAG: polysaccharide deacetylase family protein [Jatrophihabitans sp.]|uniref:polysaccharide deacetylase family protein n=1 Tax=Jatrophihabitans sp. TaxID=1932789 RepID=UPI003F81A8C4
MALTFDDGPGASTAAILSILLRAGVRATFFNLGDRIEAAPSVVRAEAAQGQTLGNHTYDHADLSTLPAGEQSAEIDGGAAAQERLLGVAPCVFRPPYGDYDSATLAIAHAAGEAVWLWSVDPEDWKASGSSSQYWIDRIVDRAEAGVSLRHPVIIFHNQPAGNPATVAALPTVIAFYRSRGYAFVDLLGRRGLAPFAPSGAPGPAAAATASGLHLFLRGPRGPLEECSRHRGRWSALRGLGGELGRAPAAAQLDARTVLVAAVDRERHVEVRSVGDTSAGGWLALGGIAASRPAIGVDRSTGTVVLAVRGPAGHIRYRQRVRGTWGMWQDLGAGFATAPALAASASGGVTLAAVDTRGRLLVRHRATTWGPWRQVTAPVVTADPALAVTGDGAHLVLALRDASGAIVLSTGSSAATGWGPWQRLGGVAGSGPTVAATGPVLNVVTAGTDGRLSIDLASGSPEPSGWTGWRLVPVG